MGATKKNWPLGQGYDRFYGFIGGETNNSYPSLAEDNHYIDQPYLPEDGYHLSKDLADQALRMIRDSKQTEPDKPWYLWFCPGANHAPHHCPETFSCCSATASSGEARAAAALAASCAPARPIAAASSSSLLSKWRYTAGPAMPAAAPISSMPTPPKPWRRGREDGVHH